MPVPRWDFAVVVLNDSLLVMGGGGGGASRFRMQLLSVDAFCLATSRSPHNLCDQLYILPLFQVERGA